MNADTLILIRELKTTPQSHMITIDSRSIRVPAAIPMSLCYDFSRLPLAGSTRLNALFRFSPLGLIILCQILSFLATIFEALSQTAIFYCFRLISFVTISSMLE